MAEAKPLVLDIDGTYLKTDMLFEMFWAGLGTNPGATLGAAARHFSAPAKLKRALSEIVTLRHDLLPERAEIAALAHEGIEAGRTVVFASASDSREVDALAKAKGLDVETMGSDGTENLKGARKAERLVAAYGERGFDYAGDSGADLAVWTRAENAIVIGDHDKAIRQLTADGHSVTRISGGWSFRDLMRAFRPHQWVKNILLLLPLIAAHSFDLALLGQVLLGIVAFSFAASSIYVVNDLLDLEADRLHPKKCKRPFASGAVPIQVGMASFLGLAAAALLIGAALGAAFVGVVAFYMVFSLAYSLRLKRLRWIDIASLASLYTLRVVAGAAATQVEVSVFMLIFIFPVFITLGCVKRLTELTLATSDERLPGRGYGRPDRGDLLNVAVLGMVGALVIFFLYTFTDQAAALYEVQWVLWLALIPMAIWLWRMIALGYLGRQDYDPIVFALRDKVGLGLLMLTLAMMFFAADIWRAIFI